MKISSIFYLLLSFATFNHAINLTPPPQKYNLTGLQIIIKTDKDELAKVHERIIKALTDYNNNIQFILAQNINPGLKSQWWAQARKAFELRTGFNLGHTYNPLTTDPKDFVDLLPNKKLTMLITNKDRQKHLIHKGNCSLLKQFSNFNKQ